MAFQRCVSLSHSAQNSSTPDKYKGQCNQVIELELLQVLIAFEKLIHVAGRKPPEAFHRHTMRVIYHRRPDSDAAALPKACFGRKFPNTPTEMEIRVPERL